jgi:glycosyltransferase involved in cell wall biosynthesis
VRVALLLQDLQLRPGVGAAVAHAASLPGAAIVLTREQEHRHWAYPGLEAVAVLAFAEAAARDWDVALCTGGATAAPLLDLRATRHGCLLVEEDTVRGVSATSLPLRFLAPTAAAAALVEDLQPGNAALHVPTVVSAAPAAVAAAPRAGVLDAASAIAARPSHADHAAAIAAASVVVALGESDPYDSLLLALAAGTPVVATTGHPYAERVTHGADGILVDPGDTLVGDEAIARAAALTPSPAPAAAGSSTLAAALDRLLADPPPPAHAVARRIAADLATAAAEADRRVLAVTPAGPPPPPPAQRSFAYRAARAAKRRVTR